MACIDLFQQKGDAFIRIQMPLSKTATRQDFVACVDVSGSMGTEQSIKTASGNRESHGFSTLDIVKHALRVAVETLSPEDRFGLVAYHSSARIVFALAYMTPDAKQKVLAEIAALVPLDCTNIFDGLEKAFECFGVVAEQNLPPRIRSVLLYTDGCNNMGPTEGPLNALEAYIAQNGLPAQVSINGFGMETDPVLMRKLADAGRGVYFFTPDASMIGTTCVNYMANLKTTVATQVDLLVGSKKYLVGSLLAGQASYVRIDSNDLGELKLNIPFFPVGESWTPEECSREKFRAELIVAIQKVLSLALYDIGEARAVFTALARKWAPYKHIDQDHAALFTDVTGELLTSVKNEDEFRRWGLNYLLAMESAHVNAKQTNFKDVSLKGYTSDFRETIKTACNKVFDSVLPPTRSAISTQSQAAPLSMSYYNNDADPCMAGHAMVETAYAGLRRVDEVVKGTILANGDHVVCVVKTWVDGAIDLVDVGSTGTPWITPYHPIRLDGAWCFPCNNGLGDSVQIDAVYSFVLTGGQHVLKINGVDCIGLGHGFTDPVAAHPYLGTDLVLHDLQVLPGYEEGLIQLQSKSLRRGEGSLIAGINMDRVCV